MKTFSDYGSILPKLKGAKVFCRNQNALNTFDNRIGQ